MKRSANYNTKQQKAIFEYILSVGGKHVTAAQIVEHFENEGIAIGRTTIYRHLDKLIESGKIRKYTIDGKSGACFQYVSDNEDTQEHFHLKCENCGELFHLQCDMLSEIRQHVLNEHIFQINTMKTILYGRCEKCIDFKQDKNSSA